ncbi:MAG TPA: plasmid pRiA4b ORF-3 family protein [Alphaproteobacteria bacterium]|nr:plasmid pRiA4b ORF-3 family protein [Alphaproteobacteria bacterium]
MANKLSTKTIAALPQVKREVWELGRRALNVTVAELRHQGEHPEILLAVQSGERGGVLRYELIASTTPREALVDFAMHAMRQPMVGRARRPQAVRVATQAEAEVLIEPLAAVGVWLEVSASVATLESFHQELERAMGGLAGGYRTLSAQAGTPLSDDVLRECFRVARSFYRAELWVDFGGEVLFEIELQPDAGPAKTLYAILMGQMGQEFGLAIYASMEDLRRFHEIGEQHEERLATTTPPTRKRRPTPAKLQAEARAMVDILSVPCIGLTFTPRPDVPAPLLEEAKALKLPLANASAFPLVMKTGEGRMQIANAAELGDVLMAMRAILAWDQQITRMDVDDEVDVTIASVLPAVGDALPRTTARTTLRINPCVPAAEDDDDLLPAELTELFQAFLDALPPPEEKGRGKAGQQRKLPQPAPQKSPYVYTLSVALTDGPVSEAYRGREISRTIEILGHQTLHDLHTAIFQAFEREEEHLYEFNLGKGPSDRSKLYLFRGGWEGKSAKARDPEATTLDALKLRVGRRLGYTFDMGDNWEHAIEVVAIEERSTKGKYPRVTAKVGAAPPQYPDEDL